MAIYENEHIEFFDKIKRNKPHAMAVAHFHDVHELYYLSSGNTKYFVGNEIFMLNEGDMIFVPKGVFHKTDSEDKSNVERMLFVFDDNFVGDEFSKYISELSENKHIRLSPERLCKLRDIIYKIEKESIKKEKAYTEMYKLYLKQMLIYISRYRLNPDDKPNASLQIVQDIAKYISENYTQDLSLQTLAKKYSISPNHLSRQFKRLTGVGLSEYINVMRISAAEKLLVTTKMPVTAVATQCGFNDSNYFASVFKRIKGITPKKYSMMNK